MKIRAFALALVVAAACGTGSETTVAPATTAAPATIFASTTIFATTTVTTTAVPTTTVEDSGEVENREEVLEDLQAGAVEILLGRGMTLEEAEIEVKKSMAEGTDPRIVEDLFRIFEDWMRMYVSHPVMGSKWTDSDARCVIFAMMTERGIYETERQLRDPRVGMSRESAEFLVRPVAECVDLKTMYRDQLLLVTETDPDCLLADVTEEQIVSWHVAQFMEGDERYQELMWEDLVREKINKSCGTATP